MSELLETSHGSIPLPIFFPDATLGVVRSLDACDLEASHIQALVMNVFHLMQKPGSHTIQALGGLHKMSGWNRPILTDSGGFQAYSLIRSNPKSGSISDAGLRFKPEGAAREYQLTPEKSIQLQLAYGADILVCLDDCTHVDSSQSDQEESVTRTVKWAKRCKIEFERSLKNRKQEAVRPLLFGVIQGGGNFELRKRCADALLEIGFDGFGYGGWPLDNKYQLLTDMLQASREYIPREYPMHALGVGHRDSVASCARMGYAMFDCALPTRDARTGRLYVWREDPAISRCEPGSKWHDTLYIDDEKHIKTEGPISLYCDCLTCTRYSVGYLRHLHKCGETLFYRLATLHNLRFMTMLMETLARVLKDEKE